MSVLDDVLAFLTGHGLSSAQAAGVAGNLQVESGLNPGASNPAEGAIGLAQWEGGRRGALQNFAARTGGSEEDLQTQLGYLWSEFQGSESDAYRQLLATSTPADAAAVFDQAFERSSGEARGQRIANAEAIAAGRPVSSGSASSSSGGGGGSVRSAAFGLPSFSVDDVARVALKVMAGAVAGALVVVGVQQTVGSST